MSRLAHSSAFGFLVVSTLVAGCGEDCATSALSAPSTTPQLALGDVSAAPLPKRGEIQVCVTGDAAAAFSLTGVSVGHLTDGAYLTAPTIEPGSCVVVARNNGSGIDGGNFTIEQTAPVAPPSIGGQFLGPTGPASTFTYTEGMALFVNALNGFTLTFRKGAEPPAACGVN